MQIIIPIVAVTLIGLICGVLLSVASKVMAVEEDPRIPELRAALPGANCGACGYSGCDGYAKALTEPGTKTNLCVPGGTETAKALSETLGVACEEVKKQRAVVRCKGTCEKTQEKHNYKGISTCRAVKIFYGGSGKCTYGCLGYGDCPSACPQGAIRVEKGAASVDETLCTGCGLCTIACPQNLIALFTEEKKTAVLCANRDMGAKTIKACKAGCIGCKKCEKTCAAGAITVRDNLATVNYDLCTGCGECAAACPVGVITMR